VAEYVRFIAKRHDIRTEERELAALHATLRERSGT
jgi:hypothetical protein